MPSEHIEGATVSLNTAGKLLIAALTAGAMWGGVQYQIAGLHKADDDNKAAIAALRQEMKAGQEQQADKLTKIAERVEAICERLDCRREGIVRAPQ